METKTNRRGFLSLVVGLAAATQIPMRAEPLKHSRRIPQSDKLGTGRIERYMLALMPDSMEMVRPGGVTILRGKSYCALQPQRFVFNERGFNLLHLGVSGDPILENEVPSDWFLPTGFGHRHFSDIDGHPLFSDNPDRGFIFSDIDADEEIIVAAVNRNSRPAQFVGSIMCRAVL